MFLATATDDGLVPAMHTLRMAEKLQEPGAPYECHIFQYGGHGFALGRKFYEPIQVRNDTFLCTVGAYGKDIFDASHISRNIKGRGKSILKIYISNSENGQ